MVVSNIGLSSPLHPFISFTFLHASSSHIRVQFPSSLLTACFERVARSPEEARQASQRDDRFPQRMVAQAFRSPIPQRGREKAIVSRYRSQHEPGLELDDQCQFATPLFLRSQQFILIKMSLSGSPSNPCASAQSSVGTDYNRAFPSVRPHCLRLGHVGSIWPARVNASRHASALSPHVTSVSLRLTRAPPAPLIRLRRLRPAHVWPFLRTHRTPPANRPRWERRLWPEPDVICSWAGTSFRWFGTATEPLSLLFESCTLSPADRASVFAEFAKSAVSAPAT